MNNPGAPPDALDLLSTPELEQLARNARLTVDRAARVILELHHRGAHREAGYPRFSDYCRDRLGYSHTSVYRLLLVARLTGPESQNGTPSRDVDTERPHVGRPGQRILPLKADIPKAALPLWSLLGRIARAAKEGQSVVAACPEPWDQLWMATREQAWRDSAATVYAALRRIVVEAGEAAGGPA